MGCCHKMLVVLMLFFSFGVEGEKVKVELYYESLCPYCANFIVNQLGNTLFQSDLISIVDLKLLPWGNTQLASNNAWNCQHGADECRINIVEACAINLLSPGEGFKLIKCIEELDLEGKHGEWRSCMDSLKINPNPIMDCYQTKMGIDLELKYADETNRLNPPHRFVPWVIVNNKPLQEDYENFVAYICKAYQGQNKPKPCKQRELETTSFKDANFSHHACYLGQSKHLTPFIYNF